MSPQGTLWKGRWKDYKNQTLEREGERVRKGGRKGEQARRLKGRRVTSWEKVEGR